MSDNNQSKKTRRRWRRNTAEAPKGVRRGNRGNRPPAPREVLAAVRERYGKLVRVVGRRERGGFTVKVDGATRALTAAMWVEEDGIVRFDSTAPSIRRRELAAAARLEAKGYTIRAEEIRNRVAPELLEDAVAVKTVVSTAATLAAVREVATAAGKKATWHRHIERGAEFGPLSLDFGRGVRVRAGVDGDEQPWFAVDRGENYGEPTRELAEVLAQIP